MRRSGSRAMTFDVTRVAIWVEGVGDLAGWSHGVRDDSLRMPAAALFGARSGRRASQLMRMSGELFERVTEPYQRSCVMSIFATEHGEAKTLGTMLDSVWKREEVSPALFCQSVYNAGSGFVSQIVENRSFTTTISAGTSTCAMGIAEALALLAVGAPEVVLVVADESASVPLQHAESRFSGEGAAFVLRTHSVESPCLATFGPLRRAIAGDVLPSPARSRNPATWAVDWAVRVTRACSNPVVVGEDESGIWCIDPCPSEGART